MEKAQAKIPPTPPPTPPEIPTEPTLGRAWAQISINRITTPDPPFSPLQDTGAIKVAALVRTSAWRTHG